MNQMLLKMNLGENYERMVYLRLNKTIKQFSFSAVIFIKLLKSLHVSYQGINKRYFVTLPTIKTT